MLAEFIVIIITYAHSAHTALPSNQLRDHSRQRFISVAKQRNTHVNHRMSLKHKNERTEREGEMEKNGTKNEFLDKNVLLAKC